MRLKPLLMFGIWHNLVMEESIHGGQLDSNLQQAGLQAQLLPQQATWECFLNWIY